jgi:hypothetical protein
MKNVKFTGKSIFCKAGTQLCTPLQTGSSWPYTQTLELSEKSYRGKLISLYCPAISDKEKVFQE